MSFSIGLDFQVTWSRRSMKLKMEMMGNLIRLSGQSHGPVDAKSNGWRPMGVPDAADGRLIGFRFETDEPVAVIGVWHADQHAALAAGGFDLVDKVDFTRPLCLALEGHVAFDGRFRRSKDTFHGVVPVASDLHLTHDLHESKQQSVMCVNWSNLFDGCGNEFMNCRRCVLLLRSNTQINKTIFFNF